MDGHNSNIASQPNKWRSWLFISLRWLGGGIIGLALGLILLILSETINPPLLGPIIAGQQEFFDLLLFYTLYDRFKSFELIENLSLTIHLAIWGIIGALLASGIKLQIRIGMIFLFLYTIMGCLFYMIWSVISLPT